MALADAIEAMSSDRHYRKALDLTTVMSEIERQAGSQFDPLVVEVALKVIGSEVVVERTDPEVQLDLVSTFAPLS